ncbi:MAG: o-succinylbenzoate synthase [Chlamydiae bacterium]|nr:o-succinylbenzoate synthase [Chlamydiota bacterium]
MSCFLERVTIESFDLSEIPTGTLLTVNESRIGVAAPLAGFSLETTEQARAQLNALSSDLVATSLSAAEVGRLPLLPSVMWALQSALLPQAPATCAIQGLLVGGDVPDCSILKVKVGDFSIDQVLELVERLPMRLRLDFNQKWSFEKATALAETISWEKVDYFEEPLNEPEELADFPYPIALDETLRQWHLEKIKALENVAALVLKPTLLGNVLPYTKLGLPIVLSSCFEGAEGVECLARLAHHLGIADEPQGLDTVKCMTL